MGGGFEYKGNWQGTTLYKIDDIVTFGGSTYRCLTGHTSQADLYDDNVVANICLVYFGEVIGNFNILQK